MQKKAARLCFGLVKNHPFVDGNKRIGAHAMLVFLSLLMGLNCSIHSQSFLM
ncbi:MAG: Fic family protein [Lacrimispora saccharolytica]